MSDQRDTLIVEFCAGWTERMNGRWQEPLLVQLGAMMTAIKAPSGEPGSGGKPKTKPPVDLNVLDLYYECLYEVRKVKDDYQRDLERLTALRLTVRELLGYDAPMISLPAVMCHNCDGPLIVAEDASSSVVCAERCGVEYPTSSWLDILAAQG